MAPHDALQPERTTRRYRFDHLWGSRNACDLAIWDQSQVACYMSKVKVTGRLETVHPLVQVRQDVENQVGHETWAIKSCAAEYFTRYLSTNTYPLLPRAVELCLIKPTDF
ncbi:uncharacterized protein An13g02230 [Aspergillus niger]|uniref:Contig An13c0070, genomic contig n=2 Tax=Aspergillus niger TaxID=5061 RepID=A2R1S2_ASPNC|nr:uncharacterized protein An13g02230 [Aspergillus niger]CAK41622.1 unnamed protein product [Aspergillus niger]